MARTETKTVIETITASGFPYAGELVHLFIGGSGLHGAQIVGKNDDDFYGVYVEPQEKIVGLTDYPHYVWSSAGDTKRNSPGDIDVCLYGLRKWARLASGGNPTALSFLFAPGLLEDPLWQNVADNYMLFAAKSHKASFEGFAHQQLDRVLGIRGKGKHGQRPELEQKHGYDVKAAMHVIRLLNEGVEYMRTGRITYPRPDREALIAIRTGAFTVEQVERMANSWFAELDKAYAESPLPEATNTAAVSDFIVSKYFSHWGC